MKRTVGLVLGVVLILAGILIPAILGMRQSSEEAVAPVITGRAGPLILDAGHGGEDGGAVSLSGVPESEINLAIVLKLDSVLGFCGTPAILLRSEDVSLHDDTAVTLREKKVSDLHNRAAAVEAAEGATLLSIHQNTYPEGRYHGAQSFYAPTEGSMALAQHIQLRIRESLQPDNSREAKQVADNVYLMNHISCPAVLVECGFLTNPEEEALLTSDAYQKKLAVLLSSAWLTAPEGAGAAEG